MSSLRDIRRRLRSFENIKKITYAVERITAARLRRAQTKAEQSRPYFMKMKEILEKLAASEYSHPLFEQREVKKIGLVVVTSDKGLAGAYNSNVLAAADDFLKKYPPENIELLLWGRKAIDYYRRKPWHIGYQLTDWGGKVSFHTIQMFSNQLIQWFLTGKFDEIWLIHTHYVNMLNRKIIVEKFLNIGKPQTGKNTVYLNYIFEPGPEEILTEILPRYCVSRFQSALNESYASELASRIVAMQMASRNSEKLIDELTLIRNRVRQEGITKEIIEISSAQQ